MADIADLEPQAVWRIFSAVCSIAHPSGQEEKLRDFLKNYAQKRSWIARVDAAGNLRIDRPGAAPETAVVLQAHLDMVPAAAPGKVFDFSTEAISPRIRAGKVVADGTSLGADDGMGVALALAMLEAPRLQGCPLAALFTVSEETGMVGARELSADFLAGKLLVNLDSGDDRVSQIGCAGGIRTRLTFAVPEVPSPAGEGVEICLEGLYGGHSGVDIDKKRTNAIITLAKLLGDLPVEIAEFSGGNADNAIPASARVRGVAKNPEAVAAEFARRVDQLRPNLAAEDQNIRGSVTAAAKPAKVWQRDFARNFLHRLVSAPNGVKSYSKEFPVVENSSNIGLVFTRPGEVELVSTQRSILAGGYEPLADDLVAHFAGFSVRDEKSQAYPAWPVRDTPERAVAKRIWQELYGEEMLFEVVHAGLECGIFAGKTPDLPMIAFFPHHGNLHTCTEFVEIASVERIYAFLLRFLSEIN